MLPVSREAGTDPNLDDAGKRTVRMERDGTIIENYLPTMRLYLRGIGTLTDDGTGR